MDEDWEDVGEPRIVAEFSTVIDCKLGTEPDPLMTTIEFVGGFVLSVLAIWFVVRLTNRRWKRPLDSP